VKWVRRYGSRSVAGAESQDLAVKTAAALGLPRTVLLRADQLISLTAAYSGRTHPPLAGFSLAPPSELERAWWVEAIVLRWLLPVEGV